MRQTIAIFAGIQVAVWVAAPAIAIWLLTFYGSHPLVEGATLAVLGPLGFGLGTVAAIRTHRFVTGRFRRRDGVAT